MVDGLLPALQFEIALEDHRLGVQAKSVLFFIVVRKACCLISADLKCTGPPQSGGAQAVRRADVRAAENLCRSFPQNRFLVSVLSRENQHKLCAYARRFHNLTPSGSYLFINNLSIVEEIPSERIELLGNRLYSATVRRAGSRAGHLQMAQHAADYGSHTQQRLPPAA